jgi:hypothetical protein
VNRDCLSDQALAGRQMALQPIQPV